MRLLPWDVCASNCRRKMSNIAIYRRASTDSYARVLYMVTKHLSYRTKADVNQQVYLYLDDSIFFFIYYSFVLFIIINFIYLVVAVHHFFVQTNITQQISWGSTNLNEKFCVCVQISLIIRSSCIVSFTNGRYRIFGSVSCECKLIVFWAVGPTEFSFTHFKLDLLGSFTFFYKIKKVGIRRFSDPT